MFKLQKYSILFFILAHLLVFKNTLASSCFTGGSFLENIERADLMVRGKVSAYHIGTKSSSFLEALDIEVLEIYRGIVNNLNIRISYDPISGEGLLKFPVGTEWIFALNKFETIGAKGDYTISMCWINYLKVEPSVIGNLYSIYFDQRFSLEEFRNMLQGTYSPQQLTYDDGVQVGRQQCIDNPASCGIKTARPETSYDPKSGKLYLPAVKVPDDSGNTTIYEVTLNQKLPSFIFDLDLNSIKIHQ